MASFLYEENTGHNRWAHIVDHKVHDGLGHEVPYGFVYNAGVRIHQVADGFHLPLQLRVHGERVCRDIFIVDLKEMCRNVENVEMQLKLKWLIPKGDNGSICSFHTWSFSG